MEFYALIEEWPGESIVYFRELPGCFSSASTTTAALQAAPAAVENYLHWVKENGLVVVEYDNSPITITLREQVKSVDNSTGPLFEADKVELTEMEIDTILNVAATARALLIEAAANLPEHLYDQAPQPGAWSINEHLRHVMQLENWYISRLGDQPFVETDVSGMSTDDVAMKIFEDAMDNELILRDLTPIQRTGTFMRDGEAWTAAKVLRRQTGHLREHFLSIEQIESQFATRR